MDIFKQYLIDEFVEDYLERQMTRREALRFIGAVTGSSAMAVSILAACGPQAEPAPEPSPEATATTAPSPDAMAVADPKVSADDPDIEAGAVEFPGEGATLLGYMARPKGDGPFWAVLVCHENRGLVEYTNDVTRRLAKAGYVGLAVDLLSRQGGSAQISDPAEVPGILGNTPPEQFVQDFKSGWSYLQGMPYVRSEGPAMIGFCFGGGVTWRVATQMPELRAAVPFYGPHPPLEDVSKINAPVLGIYGELDERINQGIPAIEAAMQESGKTFEKIIYPESRHAFHNDTGRNYNPEAAGEAWGQTLAWLNKHL